MIEKKIKILLVALGITLTISFVSWAGLGSFADKDGITDSIDNCPKVINPTQSDFDNDRIGDEYDIDDDNTYWLTCTLRISIYLLLLPNNNTHPMNN